MQHDFHALIRSHQVSSYAYITITRPGFALLSLVIKSSRTQSYVIFDYIMQRRLQRFFR